MNIFRTITQKVCFEMNTSYTRVIIMQIYYNLYICEKRKQVLNYVRNKGILSKAIMQLVSLNHEHSRYNSNGDLKFNF